MYINIDTHIGFLIRNQSIDNIKRHIKKNFFDVGIYMCQLIKGNWIFMWKYTHKHRQKNKDMKKGRPYRQSLAFPHLYFWLVKKKVIHCLV